MRVRFILSCERLTFLSKFVWNESKFHFVPYGKFILLRFAYRKKTSLNDIRKQSETWKFRLLNIEIHYKNRAPIEKVL